MVKKSFYLSPEVYEALKLHHMIYAMKVFVPEYKSNQSQFEAIDRELEESQTREPQREPETEKYY